MGHERPLWVSEAALYHEPSIDRVGPHALVVRSSSESLKNAFSAVARSPHPAISVHCDDFRN